MPITWNGGAVLRTAVRSSAVHLERRSPGIGIHGEDAAGTNGYGCCQVGRRVPRRRFLVEDGDDYEIP